MPIITADETRTRTEATPTTADLDTKYGLVQGLITTAADDGLYTVTVTLGSAELTQFNTWIKSYGYRAFESVTAGTTVRKILGTAVNVTVSWQRYTVTPNVTTVAEGNAIIYTVTTRGVADGTAYWTAAGTASNLDFTPTLSEGTVNIASGTGSITLTVAVDQIADPGETVILRLYADSFKTDLVATAATVSIT